MIVAIVAIAARISDYFFVIKQKNYIIKTLFVEKPNIYIPK